MRAPLIKINGTTITIDGARLDEFQKNENLIYHILNWKISKPACPMFSINPSTLNVGQHSGEESMSISSMEHI